ncbi:MAG: hypothetical protein ACRDAJ_16840 [Serratia fonticola]
MKKQKSPWRWPLRIVIIGCALYFSRSFWPMFFQGEPYAEIEATIPPDMTLRVGASYRSSSCTEMTFSDFSQILGRKGWSKEYTPDSQGKVTAKVYQRVIGPCNWYLNSFSVSTIYHKIPDDVLAVPTVSSEIKDRIKQRFSNSTDAYANHQIDGLVFTLDSDYNSEGDNQINTVALKTILTPSIIKRSFNDNRFDYRFAYDAKKRAPNEPYEIEGLARYGRKEPLKINYHVEVDNHILLEEFYPSNDRNTSKIIQ